MQQQKLRLYQYLRNYTDYTKRYFAYHRTNHKSVIEFLDRIY